MKPESMARMVGEIICGVVEPLKRAIQDQQQEIHDLKSPLSAHETRDTRQQEAVTARQQTIAALKADNETLKADAKSLGELVLATNYRRPTLSDLDMPDTKH